MSTSKNHALHFLLLTLLLFEGWASGQEAGQARRQQPRRLEEYQLRTLKELAGLKPAPHDLRDKQERLVVTADTLPSMAQVTSTGSTRAIPPLKKEVIRQWARLYAGLMEHDAERYQSEMAFVEDGVRYWLAVPKDSPLLANQSFKKGASLNLYLVRLGAVIVGHKYDWTFLVEEFRKEDTAPKGESWPSLDDLRSNYRATSAVAHVLVHEAEVVNRIGGYEDWRVAGVVVESFKGKLRRGQQIAYHHGAEAGLRKDFFTGGKIVFLRRHYDEPQQRWDYAALENSTLPNTKEFVAKLRRISAHPAKAPSRGAKTSRFESHDAK